MTQVAPYYKHIVAEALRLSVSRHPASFIGMFDCGKNYVFNLVTMTKTDPKQPLFVPVSLTKTDDGDAQILSAFSIGLTQATKTLVNLKTYEELFFTMQALCNNRPVTLVLHFGSNEPVKLLLLEHVYRWRNIFGKDKFNWLIFANYDILNSKDATTPLFEKTIKTNIIPVSLVDKKSFLRVYKNYTEYFGPTKITSDAFFNLTGGNTGLLKSLFLLSQRGKLNDWQSDSQTLIRIEKVFEGLSKKELHFLHDLLVKKSVKKAGVYYKNLKTFGYLNKNDDLFSPLVREYFLNTFDESEVKLSATQQKIFQELKNKYPAIVSRDSVAQVMWGARWTEDYSDWAIDQMIYAIRNQLQALKSPWQLKTKRGKGYFLIRK
ncbi:hypothetical protein COY90_03510 [Candidatus Roizmanbacteria bacterium CG_4_10_14_0_8_um_filter_39_9]|uniref:OmpR/PhoB-type domain-containing protein n=1 Tax=Candidatus Roizmanbacteria bacterium CG_4_10_14_0_8_um_filter_39_9 TaxID=1974829 RepID=A0A2M7QDD6_9BACT|nr:MAG: hypothetical protein COY90_03510 [Candidatus Roizmanbacteria bacterium CG_4_10_14_0_8_um_filter_39_9]